MVGPSGKLWCEEFIDASIARNLTVFLVGELLQGISWGVFQVREEERLNDLSQWLIIDI